MYEPLDPKDWLSEEEYMDINSRYSFAGLDDYNEWYLDRWPINRLEWISSPTDYKQEIYDLENYKRKMRLLQEALDL